MIKVGDIVLHKLSGLYYRCENKKHEKWMNENPFYSLVDSATSPKIIILKGKTWESYLTSCNYE